MKKFVLNALASLVCFGVASARENISGKRTANTSEGQKLASVQADACTPARAQSVLAINNVRTTILTGGDMWWNLSDGRYEIPKGSNKHSLFAGALWIGGLEEGTGTLKVAAMTYRQSGNDFWPGPLDLATASTDADRCDRYDKHYRISKAQVADFKAQGTNPTSIPNEIIQWPGNGQNGEDIFMAPFYDVDGDAIYNYTKGDYPYFDFTNSATTADILYGDEVLWWVFNDKGNIHSETQAVPIGLEIRAQAFGFQTNDDINNMTFYRYKIYNRSSSKLTKTWFGQWVDPDLGNYQDDYVGCDVARGLGYVYNGDNNDENSAGYGINPPALGVDFFEGPLADPNDGIDNDRDGLIDEPNEQIIMSQFVYYNNDFSPIGNPEIAPHYYGYLRGFFKDGTHMVYNFRDGWVNGGGPGPDCEFMFPGNSDPVGWGVGGTPTAPIALSPWCENASPGDRRFLQSAGPFTLQPGAVNYITTGVVWGRFGTWNGCNGGSVSYIRQIDDIAQELFNNKFRLPDGPYAPDVTIQELDKELVFYLTNAKNSNNYKESYKEFDPRIPNPPTCASYTYDKYYKFQGYIVYQLKNEEVSVNDLYDESKAKPVFQCDIKDGVAELINFKFDPATGANIGQVMVKEVQGFKIDDGIKHSFKITEDKFASGANRLVNYKKYYYMAVAYGYNSYKKYKQDAPVTFDQNGVATLDPAVDGQKIEFLPGRLNIKTYTAIPHIPLVDEGGTIATAYYGQGLPITRIKGSGAATNFVELNDSTKSLLGEHGTRVLDMIEYEPGKGPFTIKVIDPLNVPSGDYLIKFYKPTPTATYNQSFWRIHDRATDAVVVTSDTSISVGYEQIVPELGISVYFEQTTDVFKDDQFADGDLIGAEMVFKDEKKKWLTGVRDIDGCSIFNWIRSGIQGLESNPSCQDPFKDAGPSSKPFDPNQIFEGVLGGTWAPGGLCAKGQQTIQSVTFPLEGAPFPDNVATPGSNTSLITCNVGTVKDFVGKIRNVDLVITSDKSKWTRSPIFEMGEDEKMNENNGKKFALRRANSVDKEGRTASDTVSSNDPNHPNFISGTGMGWFPGYAYDPTTGERLNIAFGEDSRLIAHNGRDMKWNPTSTWIDGSGNLINGGKHYIYIFNNNISKFNEGFNLDVYDYGASIMKNMRYGANYSMPGDVFSQPIKKGSLLGTVYRSAMWVNMPLLVKGQELLATDVVVKIRVKSAYAPFPTTNDLNVYQFSTKNVATIKNNSSASRVALQMVNVVPNPYLAYSDYEGVNKGTRSQIDNRVRITYLPKKCVISIYTPNGVLVRRFKKDDDITYIDWDLKNQAGISIASGMYLIHIQAEGVGERVIKWFGVLRPIDLDAF
jgi:hypothetical protein